MLAYYLYNKNLLTLSSFISMYILLGIPTRQVHYSPSLPAILALYSYMYVYARRGKLKWESHMEEITRRKKKYIYIYTHSWREDTHGESKYRGEICT